MTITEPQHAEAEQTVLASMMHNPASVGIARKLVSATDLSKECHRNLFALLCRLFDTHGLCDLKMVQRYQNEQADGDFTDLGGWEYLCSFWNCWLGAGVPLHPYARTIKEVACRRELQRVGDELVKRAGDVRFDTVSIAEYALQQIRASLPPTARAARSLYDIALEERERIRHEAHEGQSDGFKTGWTQLNKKLAPIRGGQLVMIGARPGMGKTAFAVNWALSLAEQKLPGVIYSLEMEDTELSLRALLNYTQITGSELDQPSELQQRQEEVLGDIDRALEALPQGIMINDQCLSVTDICREVSDLKQKGPLFWVMVDFLQLARADKNYRSRAEEVGAIAYELADLSKECGVAVIALSQLSREVDKDSPRRPRKDHFLESGKIEAAAHRMMYLYRPSEYGAAEVQAAGFPKDSPDEFIEVGILKQRNAKSTGRTILHYDGDHYRFRDLWESEKQLFRGGEE